MAEDGAVGDQAGLDEIDADEIDARESTIPDLDIDDAALESLVAAPAPFVPAAGGGTKGASQGREDLGVDEAAEAAPGATEGGAAGQGGAAKSRAAIPAPQLDRAGAETGSARGLDWIALVAMIVFVLVGGLLVFGFAQALVPAAEAQLGAACRPLAPELREGGVPVLELEDLDGNPVSLADYQGKFLVVNFWATWCEPCTREWPDLATLAARVSGRDDVVVIAISVDQAASDIGPFLERMGLVDSDVEMLWAKDPAAHERFGSEKIPDTYFVDRRGQLEAVFINVREWGRAKAVRCVEASADRRR